MAFDQLELLVADGRQVIVYSMHDDSPTVMHCIELGAFTYLTKAEGKGHLVPAVQAAARDLPYTSPALAGAMHADNRARLSDQERAALLAYFQSGRKRLAAHKLNVSVSTLDTYLARARVKYANIGRPASSPYALVRRALEDGLVTADDLACE